MRLRYKLGYFVFTIIIVIGVILQFSSVDKQQLIFHMGFIGLGISGIYYFIQEYHQDVSNMKWLKLAGCVLVIVLVGIHFVLEVNTFYLLFAGYFFMKGFDKKFAFVSKDEQNEQSPA